MGEQGINHTLAVAIKLAHLGAGVTLGYNDQVDALGDVGLSVQGTLGRRVVTLARLVGSLGVNRKGLAFPDIVIGNAIVADLTDKDVGRVNSMGEARHHLAMKVGQRDCDIYGLLGHGHIVTCGKCLADLGSLLGSQPLLEERRESVDEQQLTSGMVFHLNLAVALEGHLGKAALASCPLRSDTHLLQVNLLVVVITGKHVIEAQGATIEKIVKLLCHDGHGKKDSSKGKNDSFHNRNKIFLHCKGTQN